VARARSEEIDMTTCCSPRALRNLESQGFTAVTDDAEAAGLARAARFQPAATLALLLVGVGLAASGHVPATSPAAWFGALAALAWLAVAVPTTNVFDRFWDLAVRPLTGWPGLGPPPTPRRFSQGIAATFLTTIAVLFGLGLATPAFVVSGVMAVAASLAAFANVCIGSAVYNVAFGRRAAA
jgi:hypothetical protein